MNNKFAQALLSFGIAVAMWVFVITTVSPGSKETFYNIPVVLANETVLAERGLMITNMSANTVTMELSGNRSDLSKVDSNTITLKADLSTIYSPGSMIPITYTHSFPGNVASNAFVIESKSPGRIYFTVERRVSKTIPVEVKWIGSAPEGFIADRENRVLEYDSIQIVGPQSVTDRIAKAVIEVDLNDQRESISQDFLCTLCDAEGDPVNAELITANIDQVHLDLKIQRVKDLQLTYLLVEGGGAKAENAEITLSVDNIRVCGSETAIEMLGDQLVIGTIHLSEIAGDTEKTFVIPLDEGITNLTGVTEVTAAITLRDLSTREFLLQNIEALNVPEGLEAEIFTKELTVWVRGPEAMLSRLNVEDLIAAVDFSSAEIGTSTFRVNIRFADGFADVGVLKADSVSASVTAVSEQSEEQEFAPAEPQNP